MSQRFIVQVLCVAFSSLLMSEGALAFGRRPATCRPATCAPATYQPEVQYVEKTVMCPTYVTEERTIRCVECRPERERGVRVDVRTDPDTENRYSCAASHG